MRIDGTSATEDRAVATLDIKVRNAGQAVCFVTNAKVRVQSILTFRLPPVEPLEVPVSAEYQVELPGSGAPYSRSASVSQAIRANDVDRFKFTFGCGECGRDPRVYALSVGFQYDRRESTVETGQVLLYMPPSSRLKRFFDPATK